MILDALYTLILTLASPFLIFKIITNERYRIGFVQRFGFSLKKRTNKKKCIWIHGSSVGEILTARAIINRIEEIYPDFDICISAWTNTGKDVAEKNFNGKNIFFFPVDLSFIIKNVFKKIRPDYIILIELEVWPNFFITASKLNIPIILINGRISNKSVKLYQWLFFLSKSFNKSIINNTIYCARTDDDAARFAELGIEKKNISVTGTMKYDNIETKINETVKKGFQNLFQISRDDIILVGGSTRNGEEEILINTFKVLKKEFSKLRLIIVPRHVERTNEIVQLIEKNGFFAIKKSFIQNDDPTLKDKATNSIIVVDTTGELFNVYSIADCVFVGGSMFPFGGQNVMEPAGLAKPIVFGSHMFNFAEETKMLLENDAAEMAKDKDDLLNKIKFLLSNTESANLMGMRAQKVVLENKGATDRNINILKNIFN